MEWNQECQEAFEKIKQYLEEPAVLVPAMLDKPLFLYLTVLKESMGGMLGQYMLAHTTWFIAKTDPLKYIFEKTALTVRIAHWQMALSEYDIVYPNQKAIKGDTLSEQLAHHPLNEYHPLRYKFSDEQIMATEETSGEAKSDEWKLWFDGASNLLGNGIRVVLASPKGQYFHFSAWLGFDCTNNMSEYKAYAMGITMAM
ncbi:hypothetical protein CR513_09587, partial [Mucuna pruriens]